jgi:hypothetical protein
MKPLALGFAALSLWAVGCAAPPPASDGPVAPQSDRLHPMPVVFTNSDLAAQTYVGTITKTIDQAGLMHLTVPIRAVGYDVTIDYRFTYRDGTGAYIDEPTSWQTRTLHAGTFESIEGVAPSPQGKEFELDVRPAQ